jgi:hypothetical protein
MQSVTDWAAARPIGTRLRSDPAGSRKQSGQDLCASDARTGQDLPMSWPDARTCLPGAWTVEPVHDLLSAVTPVIAPALPYMWRRSSPPRRP